MREPDRLIRAAGAVLWRNGTGGREVALVHRPRYDDWSFPKGKLEPGEHVIRAAVREVLEETGVRPLLGARLSTLHYMKDDRPKRVDYWAATPLTTLPFTPDAEVDRLEWLPVERALSVLSYPHDVELLRSLSALPDVTVPYIVLRHASAGDKHAFAGDDALRPLDERGRAEAAALSHLLSAYGTLRVISSPTARCVETLLPYATSAGVPLTTDSSFAVGGQAVTRFLDLVADAVPTVVCTHGEVVTGLITETWSHLGHKPPEDPSLRKASFWTLQTAATTLITADRHPAR